MKLYEIPVNTLIELQFNYLDERHKVRSALLFKYSNTVYVTAVRSAGVPISTKRISNFSVVYRSAAAVYSFSNLNPRMVSYNGQNLFAIHSDQDAKVIGHKNAYRLFVGAPISAKISSEGKYRYLDCILKDISMTGMGIVSKTKIEEFEKIEISFRVNEDTQEKLLASIIHTREFKSGCGFIYGCEFDEPSLIIGNYIARRQALMRVEEDEE